MMSSTLVALSTWLHILATIVMIGYFIFNSLVYLPAFEKQFSMNDLRDVLEKISARFRPYFGVSLLIFLVTGTHLMLINENYSGLGDFFSNPWSVLIIIKHVLVLVFLVLAVISERAYLAKISDEQPDALQKFRWSVNICSILGAGILLLTSFAQAG
jgi:uncharacterized membrane protein